MVVLLPATMRMCHTSSITTAIVVGSATANANICSKQQQAHLLHALRQAG
jgi:hypothetical protein